MEDKTYYIERLKFLTEASKQMITVFLAIMAGLLILFRSDQLTNVDHVLIVIGSVVGTTLLIIIFILVSKTMSVLKKIKP